MTDAESRPYALSVTAAPDATVGAVIEGGLHEFNRQKAGYVGSTPLVVLVRDKATGEEEGVVRVAIGADGSARATLHFTCRRMPP